MNNCALASIFSAVMAGLLVSLATPPDVANDAVKAENMRLVQANQELANTVDALQNRLTDLAMASKDQLDKATAAIEQEKKRLAAQCQK